MQTYEKRKENGQSPTQTFGGFQKGFLNRKKPKGCQHGKSSEKTEPKSVLSVEEKLPTICPKDTNPDDLRIPEVQEAMKTPFLLENKGIL